MLKAVLVLLATLLAAPAQAAPAPADTVAGFHNLLLDNMRHGKTLGCSGRIQRLRHAIPNTFDIPFLAQHVLRRQWSTLSGEQQAEFTSTLEDMIVSTYASQFASHGGENFTTLTTEELAGGHRVVHARLDIPHDEPVRFDYVLRDTGGGWHVINVIADGVSDLALRSAQYDRLFKDKGFDGLLTQIREQVAKIRKDC